MTDLGRLGAFITKVKKGSLADVVGHLRAGKSVTGNVVKSNLLLLSDVLYKYVQVSQCFKKYFRIM